MQADIKPLVPAELAELRGQIDRIDAEIMEALARRFAVTNNVGQLKAKYALNSVDPVREQEKLQQVQAQQLQFSQQQVKQERRLQRQA